MTQVKFNNGSIVEDTFKNYSEASPVTEAYLWKRALIDAAYSFKHKLDGSDSDLEQYIEFLKNIEVEGMALGAIQAKATDFTTSDYLEHTGMGTAMSLAPANATEVAIFNNGSLIDEMSDGNAGLVTGSNNELQVPLTSDGEAMPLLVASNERAEGVHTFEEAKEMWGKFLEHLDVSIDSQSSEDEASDEQDGQPSVNDPTTVKGVGSATVETIEAAGFEIVPTMERAEAAEPFEFEDGGSDDEGFTGKPSPSEIKELMNDGWTKEEIQDFYGE